MWTASLHGWQVQILALCRSDRLLTQFRYTLAVDHFCAFLFLWDAAFCSARHTGTTDEKRKRSALLWREGDMYCNGLLTYGQRMCPHDVTEMQAARLMRSLDSQSLSHGGTGHL